MTRSTSKPGTSESSISSLGELMRLEKERQEEEERGRLREHEKKLRADEEAARRLLAAEEEARQAVLAEARARDERERVLAAKIDAEGKATIEREKVRAIEAAREAERAKEREHELTVKRLELQAAAERSPVATLAGYALAALVLVAGLLAQMLLVGPAHDRKIAEMSETTKQNGIAIEGLRGERDAQKARADGATKDLEASRGKVSALEARIAALEATRFPKGAPGHGPVVAPSPPKPGETCLKGDPMCFTIGPP